MIVTAITFAAVVVLAAVQSSEEAATTEVAGMKMSQDDVDDMVRNSMGTDNLKNVRVRKLSDRQETLVAKTTGKFTTYDLEAKPLRWRYRDRQDIAGWGYSEQIPGPEIRVRQGTRVRVNFTNKLPDPTTVHWHGIDVPFAADGAPGITQKPVQPGDSYVYEFTATPAGTHFYHAHGSGERDEARQLDMGLSGAFIIESANEPAYVEQTLVLDEWLVESGGINAAMMAGAGHAAHGAGFNLYTINGRAAPDTTPIHVKKGQTMRLRLINAGSSATHPIHLHGHNFSVTAIDGNPVPVAAIQRRNTVVVAPGETYDVTFTANNPGVWMLHCHELHHSDAGMMTTLQYDGYTPVSGTANGGHGGTH